MLQGSPVLAKKLVSCNYKSSSEKRVNILTSDDNLKISGIKYYISSINGNDSADGLTPESAWESLDKLLGIRNSLLPGDAVLFERGSIFHRREITIEGPPGINSMIWAVSGVTYGAYGYGNKPIFNGSAQNYALAKWVSEDNNVWHLNIPLSDAGIVVFNKDEYIGIKKWQLCELCQNGDFFHDDDGEFYLFSDCGSPSDIFEDIEIGVGSSIISLFQHSKDITIDNLCLKHAGAHAIGGGRYISGVTVSNCEIGWVGGSFFPDKSVCYGDGRRARYGNGIEFGAFASDILLTNNWVYQVYDAGLTFQSGSSEAVFRNIAFKDNLIQYCNYSIEFFIRRTKEETESGLTASGIMDNIEFSGNIMEFAGYGVCEQRPNHGQSSHICGWLTDVGNKLNNFFIRNNVFDLSSYSLVYWVWDVNYGLQVENNEYYMKPSVSDNAMHFGSTAVLNAKNQNELEMAVSVFDSSPKLVKWYH